MHGFFSAFVAVMVLAVAGPAQASLVTFKGNDQTVHRGQVNDLDITRQIDIDDAHPTPTEADFDACVADGDVGCVKDLIDELAGDDSEKVAALLLRAAEGARTLADTDAEKAISVLAETLDLAAGRVPNDHIATQLSIVKTVADVIGRSGVKTAYPAAAGDLALKLVNHIVNPYVLSQFYDAGADSTKAALKAAIDTLRQKDVKAARPNGLADAKAAFQYVATHYYLPPELRKQAVDLASELFPPEQKDNGNSPSPA